MSQKSVNGSYWQTPPGSRSQILLIPTSLEERIPHDHPVRMVDEILDTFDWTAWENTYNRKRKADGINPKKNPAQLPKSDLDGRYDQRNRRG